MRSDTSSYLAAYTVTNKVMSDGLFLKVPIYFAAYTVTNNQRSVGLLVKVLIYPAPIKGSLGYLYCKAKP